MHVQLYAYIVQFVHEARLEYRLYSSTFLNERHGSECRASTIRYFGPSLRFESVGESPELLRRSSTP